MDGIAEPRVLVFGLVGRTRHHGIELLSRLFDYDLISSSGTTSSSIRVQMMRVYEKKVIAYMDTTRCLMFLHFPSEQEQKIDQSLENLILSVMILHENTKFDINILHKIRTLQMLRTELLPVIEERYPLEMYRLPMTMRSDIQEARRAMYPGYCQPQLFFLFQPEASWSSNETFFSFTCFVATHSLSCGVLDQLSKTLDEQVSHIFQKFEIPGRKEKDRVINANPVKVLLLPRFPTSLSEHLEHWMDILDSSETNQISWQDRVFRNFEEFVYSRRDRMKEMLKADSFDVFPTAESVQEVFVFILELLQQYQINWETQKQAETPSGLKSVLYKYLESTKLTKKIEIKQNHTALRLAVNMYKQLTPEIYVKKVHNSALDRAKKVFDSLCCGSGRQNSEQELISICEQLWKAGCHQCESRSLTGRRCVKSIQEQEDGVNKIAPCDHDSGSFILSCNGSGRNRQERQDPFTFEEANVSFHLENTALELSSPQSATKKVYKGRGKQPSPKQSIETTVDMEIKINFTLEHPSLCFQRRCSTKVYRWCSLVSSTGNAKSQLWSEEGFIANKTHLTPLKLHLPSLPPFSSRSEMDESFPPLRSPGQEPPPPLLWPEIQHQIKHLRITRKELKGQFPIESRKAPCFKNLEVKGLSNEKPQSSQESPTLDKPGSSKSLDVWIGLEYESLDGSRILATPQDLTSNQSSDMLSILQSQDIPLFMSFAQHGQEQEKQDLITRPRNLLQLQRIIVITPPPPYSFALNPSVFFISQELSFKAEYRLNQPAVLPSNSTCIMGLPFVYGIPSEWLKGMDIDEGLHKREDGWFPFVQSKVDRPYRAFIQKRTLLFLT